MKECNIDVLEVRQVNRIAELRKKIGLSQSALGEILGVSQQTISKYEKSDLNVPADILAKMSRVFKVSIECKFCSNGTPILKSSVHSF